MSAAIGVDGLPEGWLTLGEADVLRELARGKNVLEVGAWLGRSTAVMAQVAKFVVSVDHHHGPPFDGQGDTFSRFAANLQRLDLTQRVIPIVAGFEQVAPLLAREFDLAFIDGNHDFTYALHDGSAAWKLVRAGGVIVFHDYENHSGVSGAVDELARRWGVKIERQAESLAVVVRKVV